MRREVHSRLEGMIDKHGPMPAPVTELTTCCHIWTGAIHANGYGSFRLDAAKVCRAHIVAYELYVGPTGGLNVLHKCDNRPCCNPDHLFLGTRADNTKDMDQKGRRRPGGTKGILRPLHILTEDDVRHIRYDTIHTQIELAKQFGVTQSVISRIQNGRVWKHIH